MTSPTLPHGFALSVAQKADCTLLPVVERAAAELFRGTGLIDLSDVVGAHSVATLEKAAEAGLLFVVTGPTGAAGFALTDLHPDALYLAELSVHPAHGRKGLGRALVARVCHEARIRGLAKVTLSTFREIPWNRPFYERLGFRVLDEADHAPWHHQIRADEARSMDIRRRCLMVWTDNNEG